ncbi:hypothetical protein, partial [Streptomyces sp. DfronAA-171]|uniref:hypothetical protein n=1 Tax=Streptomyces sp. DfronAA-171 TaxID=1839777 RepID=UPI001C40399A
TAGASARRSTVATARTRASGSPAAPSAPRTTRLDLGGRRARRRADTDHEGRGAAGRAVR